MWDDIAICLSENFNHVYSDEAHSIEDLKCDSLLKSVEGQYDHGRSIIKTTGNRLHVYKDITKDGKRVGKQLVGQLRLLNKHTVEMHLLNHDTRSVFKGGIFP